MSWTFRSFCLTGDITEPRPSFAMDPVIIRLRTKVPGRAGLNILAFITSHFSKLLLSITAAALLDFRPVQVNFLTAPPGRKPYNTS